MSIIVYLHLVFKLLIALWFLLDLSSKWLPIMLFRVTHHIYVCVCIHIHIYEYIHIYTYIWMNVYIYYLLLSPVYILKLLEFFWINQVKVSTHNMNNITKLWSKWLLKCLVHMIYFFQCNWVFQDFPSYSFIDKNTFLKFFDQ